MVRERRAWLLFRLHSTPHAKVGVCAWKEPYKVSHEELIILSITEALLRTEYTPFTSDAQITSFIRRLYSCYFRTVVYLLHCGSNAVGTEVMDQIYFNFLLYKHDKGSMMNSCVICPT